jgi:hypothetical protein
MPHLSMHAERRARQRGIREDILALLFQNADVEFEIGGDCRLLRLSHEEATAVAKAAGRPQIAERLSRCAVIDSGRSGAVVTVLRDDPGHSGRRYRRQFLGRDPKYRSRRRPRNTGREFQ